MVRSVEAGKTWPSPIPVTGLRIEQGQDRLSLPLRRVVCSKPVFRQVSTELSTVATRDEPVRVEVEVKPGQGYARVRIESATPGVFAARLDWHTMQECDEPELPPLAYLRGVSRIEPDGQMFNDAYPALTAALDALRQNSPDAMVRLREAIVHLNKWPLAYIEEQKRGRSVAKDSKDVMLHYGVIGSNGNLDNLSDPGIARELRNAIGEKFGQLVHQQNARIDVGNTLLRAGGWFYLGMPEECFTYLRERLGAGRRTLLPLSPVELHAIGLAFERPDDLVLFYPLLIRALCNPSIPPNNWLRAVRNICRFRNYALRPDAIEETDLYRLTTILFETLQERVTRRNYANSQIFRNCLMTIPFLLKRRRYNSEFLAPNSPLAQKLTHLLGIVERDNRRQKLGRLQSVPRATINFLQREATESDIEALLSVEDHG